VKSIAWVVIFASCASEQPAPDLDYVTEAILVPYCGRGGCHSTNTAAHNLIFDTVEGTRAAMMTTGTGKRGSAKVNPGDPNSPFMKAITDPNRPMPPDVPLPDSDVALIRQWIVDGAKGLVP
jgi:hypothetical protein